MTLNSNNSSYGKYSENNEIEIDLSGYPDGVKSRVTILLNGEEIYVGVDVKDQKGNETVQISLKNTALFEGIHSREIQGGQDLNTTQKLSITYDSQDPVMQEYLKNNNTNFSSTLAQNIRIIK